MSFTITQASAVNALCDYLLGHTGSVTPAPTEKEAKEALATLATFANATLHAGWTPDQVRKRWRAFPHRPAVDRDAIRKADARFEALKALSGRVPAPPLDAYGVRPGAQTGKTSKRGGK